MAKTESTAINSLIELQANATPLKPAPGEDLMFAEPAKPVGSSRMSATLTNAAPVEPLPRGRGAAGTQQNNLTPPGVRVTSAQPSRPMTIPPMVPPPVPTRSSAGLTPPPPVPTRSSAGLTPPPPLPTAARSSRPSLPPPRPSAAMAAVSGAPPRPSAAMAAAVSGAPLVTPPPTDPSFDPAPLAPIDLTDQSWFEESRAVEKESPVSESTWVGTVQVPKGTTTKQWLGRLALPMGAMVVVGIFVGGYVAFDGQGGHKRTPAAAPSEPVAAVAAPAPSEPVAAPAPSEPTAAVAALAPSEPAAAASSDPAVAAPSEPAVAAVPAPAPSEPAVAVAVAAPAPSEPVAVAAPAPSEPAVAAPAPSKPAAVAAPAPSEPAAAAVAPTPAVPAAPAVTPPSVAATSAVPAATAPVAKAKATFVDVRLDSQPSGATVMLVDRGKTMFLGTTPISTALDPSRQYDVVFTYKDRPTVLEHVDPRVQSKVSVTLHHGKAAPTEIAKPAIAKPAIAKAVAPKAEQPKVVAPKAEAPKAVAKEAPKAEAPKAGGEGVLMVSSKPPCEIYIDGKATGLMTPQRSLPLPAGTHKVTLINATEKIKKTLTVQITADQPTKLIQDLMAK